VVDRAGIDVGIGADIRQRKVCEGRLLKRGIDPGADGPVQAVRGFPSSEPGRPGAGRDAYENSSDRISELITVELGEHDRAIEEEAHGRRSPRPSLSSWRARTRFAAVSRIIPEA